MRTKQLDLNRRAVAAGIITAPFLAAAHRALARNALSDAAAALDTLMAKYVGGVVLFARDGKTVARRAYGIADSRSSRLCTLNSAFRLASVSKTFTATLILMMAQEGQLNLDDRITKFLPELPSTYNAVTVKHLLTHTSGIPDYEDHVPKNMEFYVAAQNVLEILHSASKLNFEPGARFAYSNSGYCILSVIAEVAGRKPFAALLDNHIFKPLGMHRSIAFQPYRSALKDRAYGHKRSANGIEFSDSAPDSFTQGDGGIYSTVDDLRRWDIALKGNRLLSNQMKTQAFTHTAQSAGVRSMVGYGMGWVIADDTQDRRVMHSGHSNGFSHIFDRFVDRDQTLIILLNEDEIDTQALAISFEKEIRR
jgi:CubicO group peptidase (beta-lactamase class C family)